MTNIEMEQIFQDTEYVRWSGTKEELQVAEYLRDRCKARGIDAKIEGFRVAGCEMEEAHLYADGKEIRCEGFFNCGSGEVEGELYYMPTYDPIYLAGAKDKIVLLDGQRTGYFEYQDLMKAGVRGMIFRYGNANFPNDDIDKRDLREAVVGESERVLCVMINIKDSLALVRDEVKRVKISIRQKNREAESHNVIAEIPGRKEEWITLSAHYDSTNLSVGAYDNMSGCVTLLGVMDALKDTDLNYGLRFVFCGSEERGLLGSKAYCKDHPDQVEKTVLNINIDMIGCVLGKFIATVSAEEKLAGYLGYMAAEYGFPVDITHGVHASDSTSFADHGVPAVTLGRRSGEAIGPIHTRYDVKEVLSAKQMQKDIDFVTAFTARMANAVVCPVKREIPEKIKDELDKYLYRVRR